MATEILAVGTNEANSADVVVVAGTPLAVCLKDAAGPRVLAAARVEILLKDNTGEYFVVHSLTGARPATVLMGAGTYRFSRVSSASCGVFSG